ncbi:cysteate synthase [Kitasatospora sp. NPDC052896]|uniref:cysteate synthase n=1 Tax=Kitasatospora sp. NPDC052896 TaxID=3364061 RepID=UPI0037CAA30D
MTCAGCDLRMGDDGRILLCPHCQDESLLRTQYRSKEFAVASEAEGIFRYRNWLPVRRNVVGSSRPVVYRSQGLGTELGLPDLWISFSGYWPERDSHMLSGTFKELEAYTVLGRIPLGAGVLVLASAGNTAAAFAVACRNLDYPCLMVVPDRSLAAIGSVGSIPENIRVVALENGTYGEAMAYSRKIVATGPEFLSEGGVRNVGRRDGLAVVALTAYEAMGSLPDFYFQAVGSGAGAIATYEAAQRIARSGAAGHRIPRLFLCQNSEFAPLYASWCTEESSGQQSGTSVDVYAPELVNDAPPFAPSGGVRDILTASAGGVLVADQEAAVAAAAMFEALEGMDIEPAAAVAVACLRDAVAAGRVPGTARVLLNITGGGRKRRYERAGVEPYPAGTWFVSRDSAPEVVAAKALSSLRG